jgi:hypothetical protein
MVSIRNLIAATFDCRATQQVQHGLTSCHSQNEFGCRRSTRRDHGGDPLVHDEVMSEDLARSLRGRGPSAQGAVNGSSSLNSHRRLGRLAAM